MTEIHVRINRLLLRGFNYHDHLRISAAVKRELASLIKEGGASYIQYRSAQLPALDAASFNISKDMNPRLIGAEIARSVYKVLKSSHDMNLQTGKYG